MDEAGFFEGCSFTPSTDVSTEDGERPIGDLHEGEKVWAYNPQTQKMELQPIVHVWIHHDDDLVDLTITTKTGDGKQKSEVIHTNKKHPFLTTEKGFVKVADLHVDMHVVRADGRVGVITTWQAMPGSMVMYNLEVAQDHTFTVGDGLWVIHNCGEALPPEAGSTYERELQTKKGPVTMLAGVKIEGKTLILEDIIIYGEGVGNLTGLTREMLGARTALLEDARKWGFEKLILRGIRGKNSSSANPGKNR